NRRRKVRRTRSAHVRDMTERKNLYVFVDEGVPGPRERTIATCRIFNTTRRKWLNLHDFEQSLVESRRIGRRVESRGLTVPQMEPIQHDIAQRPRRDAAHCDRRRRQRELESP